MKDLQGQKAFQPRPWPRQRQAEQVRLNIRLESLHSSGADLLADEIAEAVKNLSGSSSSFRRGPAETMATAGEFKTAPSRPDRRRAYLEGHSQG